MKSIKTLAILAAFVVSSAASATGLGIGIGGVAHGWAGDASGKATSISNGNAIAASQVAGTGASFQHTTAVSGGSAAIGGTVTPVGANVVTNTTQFATVASVGAAVGNAHDYVTIDGQQVIANGTIGYASSENTANGKAHFNVGQIGGVVGIGGIVGFGHF